MKFCSILLLVLSGLSLSFTGCGGDSEPSVIVAPQETEAEEFARRTAEEEAQKEALKSLE